MPWLEASAMSLKREFVTLADQASMTDLCRRFNISRKTGYKWRGRFLREGMEGLQNRSRRPGARLGRRSRNSECRPEDPGSSSGLGRS